MINLLRCRFFPPAVRQLNRPKDDLIDELPVEKQAQIYGYIRDEGELSDVERCNVNWQREQSRGLTM